MHAQANPLRRRLGLLFLVTVVDILGFGVLIPLVPYMGDRFGASPAVITAILGSYSLCQFIAAPLWGRLSDRYGRRAILMSSLAGACISYAILGMAHGLGTLLLSRMLAGLMAGNIAAAFAYASDISSPAQRAASLGMVGAAIGVGFTLGQPIGGVLAGPDPARANFVAPAVLSASLSLLAIVLVWRVLPESNTSLVRARHRERRRLGPLRLLRERPGLRVTAMANLLVTYSQSVLESIFAIWALHKFGFGPRTVGFMLFGVALPALLVQGGAIRRLVTHLGEARVAVAGVLLYVLGLLLIPANAPFGVTIAGLVCCGVGLGAFNPSVSALASRQAEEHDRGAVMGTYQSSGSLARVLGPFTSGPIYALIGPSAPFLFGACITLPAAWLAWRARRAT